MQEYISKDEHEKNNLTELNINTQYIYIYERKANKTEIGHVKLSHPISYLPKNYSLSSRKTEKPIPSGI